MRNNFKKFAAIALALVMCVSTLVPVFAEANDVCPGKDAVHTKTNCTYTVVGTTEADCDNNGAETGRCNICNKTFAVSTTPALGHKWETKTGDCLTGTRQVCATCGASRNTVAAAGHDWSKYVVDGGECKQGANATKTCSVCGATEKFVMADDHNWVLVEMTNPENCLTKGTATYKCGSEGCTATHTREVWADGVGSQYHAWAALTTTSWTNPAYADILTEEDCRVAAQKKASNCYTNGVEPEFCTFCGEIRLRQLAKTNHDFKDASGSANTVAQWKTWLGTTWATTNLPTCTDKGYKPYVQCLYCTTVKTLNIEYGYYVNASGEYDGTMTWAADPITGKLPTAMTDDELKAITIETTAVADYELAAQHKLTTVSGGAKTAATCTSTGKYDVECLACQTSAYTWTNKITVDKLGHTYLYDLSEADQEKYTDAFGNPYTVVTYQSCQTPEEITYDCLNGCGKTSTKETKPELECVASSTYGVGSVVADCENDGVKLIVCKYCGEDMGEEVIPALGHKMTVKNYLVAPTHAANGYYYKTCANVNCFQDYGTVYTTNPALNANGSTNTTGSLANFYATTVACAEEELGAFDVDDSGAALAKDCFKANKLAENGHTFVRQGTTVSIDDPDVFSVCADPAFGTDNVAVVIFECSDPACNATTTKTYTKQAHTYYEAPSRYNELYLGTIRTTTAGSCTNARVWSVDCKTCPTGSVKTSTVLDDSGYFNKGHEKVVVDEKVEPTCSEFGYEATWYCANCTIYGTKAAPLGGTTAGVRNTIDPNHYYTTFAQLETLVKNALSELDVKYTLDTNSIFVKPSAAVNSTVAVQNWVAYLTADKDKDVADRTYLDKVAIDEFLTFTFAVPGTCTTAPVFGGFSCTKCNTSNYTVPAGAVKVPYVQTAQDAMFDAVGNTHTLVAVDTTTYHDSLCETDDYDIYECSVCEKVFLLNYTEGKHVFNAAPDAGSYLAPTCVLEGAASYTCTVTGCGFVKVETIDANGHWTDTGTTGMPSQKITDTCLDRTVDRYCGVCKQTIPMSHKFGEWTANGDVETRQCTDCATVEERAIGAPETEAPVTDAPVTDAPVTDAPVTDAPVTDAPAVDDEPKSGCGSSIAAIGVALVATLGTCAVFCGKKED